MRRVGLALIIILVVAAAFMERRRPAPATSSSLNSHTTNDLLAGEASPSLRASRPRSMAGETPAAQIVATADGFAPVIVMPPDDPKSRWHNPAKQVLPTFPKNFADAVRVRSGVANVSARPVNARADSVGKIVGDTLVYENAFEGCEVSYRCSSLKTEEFITVKNCGAGFQPATGTDEVAGKMPVPQVASERQSSIARGGSPWTAPRAPSEPCEGRPAVPHASGALNRTFDDQPHDDQGLPPLAIDGRPSGPSDGTDDNSKLNTQNCRSRGISTRTA